VSATLTEVMDGLAALATTALGTSTNVYAYPVEAISVPCVVVGYPTVIDFDPTYGGGIAWSLPVWHVVGKVTTKSARDDLSDIVGTLRTALNAAHTFGAAASDVRCEDGEIATMAVGGVEYLALKYTVHVI